MEDWQEIKLGNICEIKYGKDHKKLDNGNIPVYGSGGVIRYVDTYIYDNKSVLIPRKGTLKNLFFVDEKFWTVDTIFWTKFKNSNVFEKYIYYFLQTQNLESYNVGTAVPSLTTSILNELKIKLPPLEEQKAIAKTLSCLDEKIELNNKINKNLEEMAQAIFKKWFIDFYYPLTEEEIANGGREFVDSELGKIPKGWEILELNKICDINIGKTPPRKEKQCFETIKSENNINWVSIGDMKNNGIYILNTYEKLTINAINKYKVKIIPKETIILSFKLTVGKVGISYDDLTTNEAIAHLNLKNFILKEYLFFYLKNFNFSILGSTSSIATAINSKIIKEMLVLLPNIEFIEKFSYIVKVYLKEIKYLQLQNEKLKQIRDTLLPKLINGDVRVLY